MTIDTRWMDVDKLLEPAPQSQEELRQRVVLDLSKARFDFPTPQFASFRTFVNVPEVALPVKDEDGVELTPDIVVVETPTNFLKVAAQVETAETVTEERAKERWAAISSLPDVAMYLYVPVGHGAVAKRICRKLGIDVYGFRTWRYVPQGLEVNDISEAPGLIASLMPGFLRRIMRGV